MIELTLLGLQTVRASEGASRPAGGAAKALRPAGVSGDRRRRWISPAGLTGGDVLAGARSVRGTEGAQKTLYHLRETIGDGVLITRGDDAVAIDPESLTCDVTKLEAAVSEGRFEEAVDLYRGELLAGVHFPNAGEVFEEWLSRERARIVGLVLVRCIRWWSATRRPETRGCRRVGRVVRVHWRRMTSAGCDGRCRYRRGRRSRQRASSIRSFRASVGRGVRLQAHFGIVGARGSHSRW